MSKFKPGPMFSSRPAALRHPVTVQVDPLPRAQVALPANLAPVHVNAFQKAGFVMLCIYAIAPLLNDIGGHLGVTPRLTLIPLAILFFCTAFSGQMGRALQVSLGRWWLALFVIMIIATPFSFWISGSVTLLEDYGLKRWVTLFFICAVQVTAMQCIRFAYVNILYTSLLLFMCFWYGSASELDGRFLIPESLFFSNSNDLAIGLLVAATSLFFAFFASGFLIKFIATSEITLCLLYILKTGSRGTFLAVVVAAVCAMIFAKKRFLVAAIVPLMLITLIAVVPSTTMQRLVSIVSNPEEVIASGAAGGDVESQFQRQDLLKQSLMLTITHPLLGVGPGMFDNYLQQGAKVSGVHRVSLNTHNSYTQISSECGIPALICYAAVIILTGKLNYRMYRSFQQTALRQEEALRQQASRQTSRMDASRVDGRLTGIAFSGFIGAIAFAVASTFHHIGYGNTLAWMGGQTIALWLATMPATDPRQTRRI
jgi:O-antigen ligase